MYSSEFRKYTRYPMSTKAVVTRRDEDLPESLTMQVVTISQGGMGVYTDVFMKKATPVSVELLLYARDGMTKSDVFEGRIASVCYQEKDYFVGIAFDREIPYDHLIEMIS